MLPNSHSEKVNCFTATRNWLGQIVVRPGILVEEMQIATNELAESRARVPALLDSPKGKLTMFSARCVRRLHQPLIALDSFDPNSLLLKVAVLNRKRERVRVMGINTQRIGHWVSLGWSSGVNYEEALFLLTADSSIQVIEERQSNAIRIKRRKTTLRLPKPHAQELLQTS